MWSMPVRNNAKKTKNMLNKTWDQGIQNLPDMNQWQDVLTVHWLSLKVYWPPDSFHSYMYMLWNQCVTSRQNALLLGHENCHTPEWHHSRATGIMTSVLLWPATVLQWCKSILTPNLTLIMPALFQHRNDQLSCNIQGHVYSSHLFLQAFCTWFLLPVSCPECVGICAWVCVCVCFLVRNLTPCISCWGMCNGCVCTGGGGSRKNDWDFKKKRDYCILLLFM